MRLTRRQLRRLIEEVKDEEREVDPGDPIANPKKMGEVILKSNLEQDVKAVLSYMILKLKAQL